MKYTDVINERIPGIKKFASGRKTEAPRKINQSMLNKVFDLNLNDEMKGRTNNFLSYSFDNATDKQQKDFLKKVDALIKNEKTAEDNLKKIYEKTNQEIKKIFKSIGHE